MLKVRFSKNMVLFTWFDNKNSFTEKISGTLFKQ